MTPSKGGGGVHYRLALDGRRAKFLDPPVNGNCIFSGPVMHTWEGGGESCFEKNILEKVLR